MNINDIILTPIEQELAMKFCPTRGFYGETERAILTDQVKKASRLWFQPEIDRLIPYKNAWLKLSQCIGEADNKGVLALMESIWQVEIEEPSKRMLDARESPRPRAFNTIRKLIDRITPKWKHYTTLQKNVINEIK